LLSLQEVIIKALGADVWSAVRASLVRHGDEMVAVVHCPARTSKTWHREEDGGERFYMRASNGTRELNGSPSSDTSVSAGPRDPACPCSQAAIK
jgi:hypothetical protein